MKVFTWFISLLLASAFAFSGMQKESMNLGNSQYFEQLSSRFGSEFSNFNALFLFLGEKGLLEKSDIDFLNSSLRVFGEGLSGLLELESLRNLKTEYKSACSFLSNEKLFVKNALFDEILNFSKPNSIKSEGFLDSPSSNPPSFINIPSILRKLTTLEYTTNSIDYILGNSDHIVGTQVTEELEHLMPNYNMEDKELFNGDNRSSFLLQYCIASDVILGSFGEKTSISFSVINIIENEIKKARRKALTEEMNKLQ